MVYELIITGLGDVLGYEFLIFSVFMFAFLIMVVSRGLGLTASIGSILLTSYLFSENLITGRQLLESQWYIAILILVGLLIGHVVFAFFLRR